MIKGTKYDGIQDNVYKVAEEENLEYAAQLIIDTYDNLLDTEFAFYNMLLLHPHSRLISLCSITPNTVENTGV